MMLKPILLLLFIVLPFIFCQEEFAIESSKETEENAEARFIFVQAFTTVFQTAGTSTLSTFPTCYQTAAGISTCSSTLLTSGRRKRGAIFSQEAPFAVLNGKEVDVRKLIKATRVSMNISG